MALPEPFSDIEHLQLVVRRYLNKEIRAHFRDLHDDNNNWEPEVNSTRGAMLRALLHEDSDPIAVTTARMLFYYFTYGKQQETPQIIDMHDRLYDDFNFRPEIKLYFSQSRYDIPKDQTPATGEITYKIINETSESLTEANVRIRAERIKRIFAEPNSFIWHKGKLKYTYLDLKNGYDFRLLVTTETEAKRIIQQTLDIETKTPDWDFLVKHEPLKEYTTTVQTKRIYGKNRKVPRWRPREDVRFRYATIKIHGIPNPIYIVDCRHGEAAIKVAA